MRDFVHHSPATRIVFASGALARVADEAGRLGMARAMVIATRSQGAAAGAVLAALGGRAAGLIPEAVMHVPKEHAEAARARCREAEADGLIAIGGGSAVGLAKSVALELALPILAVPTTYAGSEMTSIWGMTEGGLKTTGRNPSVRPATVVYDPDLTLSLPQPIAAPSGLNAMAHAVEALYAENADPITAMLAEACLRDMAAGLRAIAASPDDREGRARALYAACLGGMVLETSAMAIHHKLCHVLGGSFNLPHAETHAVILPHAAAFNAEAAPHAMARVAAALGAASGPAGLYDLAVEIGAPTSLAALGLAESDLDRAAALAVESPYYNPRPVDREGVRSLLAAAYQGVRPD